MPEVLVVSIPWVAIFFTLLIVLATAAAVGTVVIFCVVLRRRRPGFPVEPQREAAHKS